MVAVKEYEVTATRWERGWELDIDGVGVTQSRTLRDAEEMVRDYLRLEGVKGHADAGLHIIVEIEGVDMDEVRAVKGDQDRVAKEMREVAKSTRDVARKIKRAGLTGADAARVMGVSEQRFSQLMNA